MKTWFRHGGAALLLLLSCGCLQTKDELTLEADGSGTVRLETRSGMPGDLLLQMPMGMLGERVPTYPPVTREEVSRFFPAKDFTVAIKEARSDTDGTVLVLEAAFKNIQALLDSPYAAAHALSLDVDNGQLTLKGVTGLEAAARVAEADDRDSMVGLALPGLAALRKRTNEMRTEFRINLPAQIRTANGAKEGRSVAWIVDRSKTPDAAEFQRNLGMVLEASCSADGLKFTPRTPPRLGLAAFNDLPAGDTSETRPVPDAQKIVAAARFVPCALHVTRSFDLSGDAGGQGSRAQLLGVVTLPRELAPERWSRATLLEAVDAKGTSLKLKEDAESDMPDFRSDMWMSNEDAEDDNADSEAAKSTVATNAQHLVSLAFRAPDWKSQEIARIKGSLDLRYFAGARIAKLTNAVPASWIQEADRIGTSHTFGDSDRAIDSPGLSDLGLTLRLNMGMAQSGVTMLTLQTEGDDAALANLQVFDAAGHPWPTLLQPMAADNETTYQVLVAGRPKPPLSLGLLVHRFGAKIELPFAVEHVPVGPGK